MSDEVPLIYTKLVVFDGEDPRVNPLLTLCDDAVAYASSMRQDERELAKYAATKAMEIALKAARLMYGLPEGSNNFPVYVSAMSNRTHFPFFNVGWKLVIRNRDGFNLFYNSRLDEAGLELRTLT